MDKETKKNNSAEFGLMAKEMNNSFVLHNRLAKSIIDKKCRLVQMPSP